MRKKEQTKTVVIVILAIVIGLWLLGTIITNTVDTTGNNDANDYEYGIPLQHVVEIHYMELGGGLNNRDTYPVFKTTSDGWIVYTVQSKANGERVTEVVFNGPEFWDKVKKGDRSDTTNWQE